MTLKHTQKGHYNLYNSAKSHYITINVFHGQKKKKQRHCTVGHFEPKEGATNFVDFKLSKYIDDVSKNEPTEIAN